MKLVRGFLAAIIMGLVIALIIGLPVMLLWNWLMPTLFGLTVVTFWQAVGLAVLFSLMFGSSIKL